MVIGATGAVGVICSHLLARAFEEVHLVGRNIAKLLALQESILKEVALGEAACLHPGGHEIE
jgi:short-subunit dehydrogenase